MKPIDLDCDPTQSDWTKQSWDLPPYQSKEFWEEVGPDFDLDHFKTTPVYLHAVEAGLIHDDEWVADCCSPAEHQPAKRKAPRSIIIHHHKD
jgi:hypothetical protein